MTTAYIIGQGFGLIALAIGLTVFLQKSDRKLKYRLATYTGLISVHFFLLGAYPAAISAALNGTRTIVSIHYRKVQMMYLFMALTLILAVPKITHWMEVLPIMGTFMSTYAFFKLTDFKMRYFMCASSICWTIFNIWVGSIGGSLIEGTFVIMNVVTTYRFHKMMKNGINPFNP